MTYAEADADASAGHVYGHHYLELKSEYTSAKNDELAGDLAALANDSGLLVVGVARDRTIGRSIGLTPFGLMGFVERVERMARMSLDPPLNVECTTLADAAGPSGASCSSGCRPVSSLRTRRTGATTGATTGARTCERRRG